MKPRNILVFLLIAFFLVGCNKNQETEWGTFNEPVERKPIPAAAGGAEISTIWKQKIGDAGDFGYAILRPAISQEGIFVVNRKGRVRLLDTLTGKVIWSTSVGESTYAGVGIGAGLAVVGLDDGTVVALDATTGEEQWRVSVNRQISAIPAGGVGRVVVRTADGMVLALDATNGEKLWELQRPVPGLSIHGDSQPLISGDTVITGLTNGRILVNSVLSGREFWEKDLSLGRGTNELESITDIDVTPVIDGPNLYVGTYQGEIVSLNLQDSTVQWQFKASSRLPLSISDGQLVLTDELGSVVSLDAIAGFLNWEQKAFQGRGISNPVIVGGHIVIGDARGKLYVLDILQGKLLKSLSIGRSAITSIQKLSDSVLVSTTNGTIARVSVE